MATDTRSMDALAALPYLDAVCRETLRLHPPVPFAGRVAQKDDVIPLEETFTDVNGRVWDCIKVAKGDFVNRLTSGADRSGGKAPQPRSPRSQASGVASSPSWEAT